MAALSANEIKRIRSLAQKKFRDELGLFVVEGEKMVAEALASGFEVEAVYRREEIGDETMGRISQLSSPSPALAVVRRPEIDLRSSGPIGSFEWPSGPIGTASGGFCLALDRLRDPGNLGTILRLADWFGIDAVFASPDSVDYFNPKVVQATMGAIFRVKFYSADIVSLCRGFASSGGRVYGTFLDGENIYEAELSCGEGVPAMVVVGNEADGISTEVAAECTDRLFIPPFNPSPAMESLNAAIATAIAVSEFKRRSSGCYMK